VAFRADRLSRVPPYSLDEPMKVMVVDDDEVTRTLLGHYIGITDGLVGVPACASGPEAARTLAEEPVDLLLLDVEMPQLSGLDLLASLERRPDVILVSGSKDYAVDAFELAVTDYMLKPVSYPRFLKAVQRVRARRKAGAPAASQKDSFIFLKSGRQLLRISLQEIDRVEGCRDYVWVHFGQRKLLAHATLASLEKALPAEDFVRVHRSHIVRLDRITDIFARSLVVGDKVIRIGAHYQEALSRRISALTCL